MEIRDNRTAGQRPSFHPADHSTRLRRTVAEPENRWDERYVRGDLPWDTGCPDTYLVRLISRWQVCRGTVLEIGCGTGTNSIWLAEQGFDVIGLDLSAEAVAIASRRADKQGIASCRFICGDFLDCDLEEESCRFLFDRGCLHSMPDDEQRLAFAGRVAEILPSGGLWLSMIGNADDPVPDQGPPKLSALQIATVMEPLFEILNLESCMIESRRGRPPRYWQCLLRKR
ncbi:MAG TPA: class I SAM-dependent methyltransferase [Desulfobulbus sp.]|nr:class I SAM-dependent methyltransferase [Desulfobulbus sp.]